MRRIGAMVSTAAILGLLVGGCGGGSAGTSSTPARTEPSRVYNPPEPPPLGKPPAGRSIELGNLRLVGPHSAWALAAGHLLWTGDEGRRWREITPPNLRGRLGNSFFVNDRDGWTSSGRLERKGPVTIDLTHDGGRHWTRGRIAGDPEPPDSNGIGLSFPDREHGFAEVAPIVSGSVVGSPLYATDDGGRHWSLRGEDPAEGPIEFTSRRRGWGLSAMVATVFYTTADGGRHWTPVHLKTPPWAVHQRYTKGHEAFVGFGLPLSVDGRPVLPVTLEDAHERTHLALYARSASGWRIVWTRKLKGLLGGPQGSVSEVPPDGVVIHDPGVRPLTLVTFHGDRTTTTMLSAHGFDGEGVDFADRRHGASLPCPECGEGNLPFWTADGGRRWVRRPVRLRR